MSDSDKNVISRIGQGIKYLPPFAYRFHRASRNAMRRAMHKPRTVAEIICPIPPG